jgi:hypothetical protein
MHKSALQGGAVMVPLPGISALSLLDPQGAEREKDRKGWLGNQGEELGWGVRAPPTQRQRLT